MSRAKLGAVVLAGLLVAACATPTPYQPVADRQPFGYAEAPIESNRYRVSFSGNTVTKREQVEDYMLYRAAELTLKEGFDYFVVSQRDTDEKTRTDIINRGPSFGYSHFGFGLGYRYFHPRRGWYFAGSYGPFGYRDAEVVQSTRYEAFAEISLFRGTKPADNAMAFDARDVVKTIGPKVVLPTAA